LKPAARTNAYEDKNDFHPVKMGIIFLGEIQVEIGVVCMYSIVVKDGRFRKMKI